MAGSDSGNSPNDLDRDASPRHLEVEKHRRQLDVSLFPQIIVCATVYKSSLQGERPKSRYNEDGIFVEPRISCLPKLRPKAQEWTTPRRVKVISTLLFLQLNTVAETPSTMVEDRLPKVLLATLSSDKELRQAGEAELLHLHGVRGEWDSVTLPRFERSRLTRV